VKRERTEELEIMICCHRIAVYIIVLIIFCIYLCISRERVLRRLHINSAWWEQDSKCQDQDQDSEIQDQDWVSDTEDQEKNPDSEPTDQTWVSKIFCVPWPLLFQLWFFSYSYYYSYFFAHVWKVETFLQK